MTTATQATVAKGVSITGPRNQVMTTMPAKKARTARAFRGPWGGLRARHYCTLVKMKSPTFMELPVILCPLGPV